MTAEDKIIQDLRLENDRLRAEYEKDTARLMRIFEEIHEVIVENMTGSGLFKIAAIYARAADEFGAEGK